MVKADVCQAGRCHHVFDLWGAGFIVRDGQPLFHCQKHAPPILARCAVTREGMILADFDLTVFNRLRQKRLIESRSGSPYRISNRGRTSVRAQLDNQGA